MNFELKPLAPGLYLVATPIGSARDITLRALDVLASADMLAAEDTRTLRKLMDIHGIPLAGREIAAIHDHSGTGAEARLVSAMAAGRSVAYASEAGTPVLADPGFTLARAAIAAGVAVTAAPGASALLAALCTAGLPAERFAFIGFLPAAQEARRTEIAALRELPFTMVFYESPKRVGEMLGDLRDVLGGDRQAVVARELTKRFEEVRRGTLADLAAGLEGVQPKGEFVVLAGRGSGTAIGEDEVRSALKAAMREMRMKDAATAVAGALGLPRRQVYQIALGLEDGE